MTRRIIVKFLIINLLVSSCDSNIKSTTKLGSQRDTSITSIEIMLRPAFNFPTIIVTDMKTNTVRYVRDERLNDTTIHLSQEMFTLFETRLDSFEAYTQIDSFYSQTFLESIRSKTGSSGVRDGLHIFTVVKRGNQRDTIISGNQYPNKLDQNIISQLDYISKRTNDTPLITYIKDVRSYLH